MLRLLKAAYPSQFKIIRYEDGALNPLDYARDIFSFLNLNFTENVMERVRTLTSNATSSRKALISDPNYTTHRDNPVLTMQKWRYSAKLDWVAQVDQFCAGFYPLFGYRKIDSLEDLRGNRTLVMDPQKNMGVF